MPRSRRASQTAAKPPAGNSQPQSGGEFTCPECGKTFTRAASLGAHRRRSHGVAGASSTTRSGRRRSAARTAASGSGSRRRTSSRRTADGVRPGVDRDVLLQALFPNGLPARESVIRAANDWLDQAEQLARMK